MHLLIEFLFLMFYFSPQEIEELEKSERDEKEFEELVSFIQQRLTQTEVT